MRIHGHDLDLDALRARVGTLRQVVGWRQATLGDGMERGVRVVEARTAGGFDISCLIDRALDVGDASIDGFPIAWRAPTGYAHPGYFEATEMGLQRTVGGGLFFSAGLDHALFPVSEQEPAYAYPLIGKRLYPMHGRIAHTPAELVELTEDLAAEPACLRVRARTVQASLFGEYLELDRMISTCVGMPEMRVVDTITNLGGTPTPHMMLYHVNFGFPLIAPGTRPFGSRIRESTPAAANDPMEVPFSAFGEPVPLRVEQVWGHRLEPDAAGFCHVGVWNPTHRLAVGLSFDGLAMPHCLEWRVERSGVYALGFEPSTVGIGGRPQAVAEGALRYLRPGESTTYQLVFWARFGEGFDEARAEFGAPDLAL